MPCEFTEGRRHKFPNITHFDIYRRPRQQAISLAIGWFDRYLKLWRSRFVTW
jgi:hypothetical protein